MEMNPAALAMAQATGAFAPELLLAFTLGYDVMGRVGEAARTGELVVRVVAS
ncbi:MAG: hypothetical protein HYY45_08935 [Deltaproteobacteria bacterium]|nr:hypothetical protein [Deltaproteobacteria bacterium]